MKTQTRNPKILKPSQRVLRWRKRWAGRKPGNMVVDIRELRGV